VQEACMIGMLAVNMVLKSETQSLREDQPSAVVPSPPKTVHEVADSRSG
jgi:hypothetical protein